MQKDLDELGGAVRLLRYCRGGLPKCQGRVRARVTEAARERPVRKLPGLFYLGIFMSAEWAIGIMTAFVAIMLAVFGHLNARIKELNTAHQELANRVALECVTYERLEKIIQQSLGVVTSTLNRLETDLADLKPIKDSMIRLETKMALSS